MTTYDENSSPEYANITIKWQAIYQTFTLRMDQMDQMTEKVFMDMGLRLGSLVKSCKDVTDMTHQATAALSRYETIQAAELLSDKRSISNLHGAIMDTQSSEKLASLSDRSVNHLHELSDLLINLDGKTTPMVEKVKILSQNLSNRMNRIVVAVQFQDITRQEIDKVRNGLRDLTQWATREGEEKDANEEEILALLVEIIRACELQGRRLKDVAEMLSDAWSNIHKSLAESREEVMNVCIIMSSLAHMVQEIPHEFKRLIKQHKDSDPGPEIDQEAESGRKEFVLLSKAVLSGSMKILSINNIVDERARSLSDEISEMENVFIDDKDISSIIGSMISDLDEMASFSRAAASALVPEGVEISELSAVEPGSVRHREDTETKDHDGGMGSIELF